MRGYEFRQFYISEHMMGGIRRYIDEGLPPGHFLSAIIQNDLREAVGRADDENIANIPAFVAYFYNEAPGPCWGSPAAMRTWIDKFHGQPSTVGRADEDADSGDPQGASGT